MKAEYIDHMGDDLRVVNAARVSFDKESTEFTWREDIAKGSDEGLVSYLSNHGHWTPFSHAMITMRETVPIFVARQRFKHKVGFTENEVSRRYVDDEPEFYYPEVWRGRAENKKQGSGAEVIVSLELNQREVWDDPTSPFVSFPIKEQYAALIGFAEDTYNLMIKNGVAPEQARMVLPQSMYTSYYVTGSLAAWARAYKLRSKADAQFEIRELADEWNKIIEPLFPVSWTSLVNHNA